MIGMEKIEDIQVELNQIIIPFLYEPISDDPSMIIERGNMLQVFMARLSKMLADVKYYQDRALVYYAKGSKSEVVGTIMNSYVKALCTDENYMVNLIESLLKKCYAENEWMRTLISKAKEELRINNSH